MTIKHYIYTDDDCPRCKNQKREWTNNGITFEERSSERLKGLTGEYDNIDELGFADLCMNNMKLPAIVIYDDKKD